MPFAPSAAPVAGVPAAPAIPAAPSLFRRFGLRRTLEIDALPMAEPVDPAVAVLIDEIRAYNPSAPSGFLASFTKRDLEVYLEHLASAKEPRGRAARWVRPGDTPAMVLRQQHD